jgi:predicted transcriptional regulator
LTAPDKIDPFAGLPAFEATDAMSQKAVDHVKATLDAAVAATLEPSPYATDQNIDNRIEVVVDGLTERFKVDLDFNTTADQLTTWEPTETQTEVRVDDAGNVTATVTITNIDGGDRLAVIATTSLKDPAKKMEKKVKSAKVALRIDLDKGEVSFNANEDAFSVGAITWD